LHSACTLLGRRPVLVAGGDSTGEALFEALIVQSRRAGTLQGPVAIEVPVPDRRAAWYSSLRRSRREARRLGTGPRARRCDSKRMNLARYDRLFPSQDMLPDGGAAT